MERLKQNWWLNFLIYFSGINFCFAQVFISQQNVIGLDSALTCSPRLAKNLLAYKFIMMGEMHGTEEPVRYLQSLAMQLAKKKR